MQILTVLMAMGLIGLFFALMAVRLFFKKDGEFKGTCASQSPFLNKNGETCSFCGKDPAQCDNKQPDMPAFERVAS